MEACPFQTVQEVVFHVQHQELDVFNHLHSSTVDTHEGVHVSLPSKTHPQRQHHVPTALYLYYFIYVTELQAFSVTDFYLLYDTKRKEMLRRNFVRSTEGYVDRQHLAQVNDEVKSVRKHS